VECDKRQILVLSSEEISAGAMSFGVEVWNFQEVRLIVAVVFKNWRWTWSALSDGVFCVHPSKTDTRTTC